MKAKRQKEIALKKQKEQDQDRNKLIMKERLLALDLKAIAAVAKVSYSIYEFFHLEVSRLNCNNQSIVVNVPNNIFIQTFFNSRLKNSVPILIRLGL